jgi:hypothetical protein
LIASRRSHQTAMPLPTIASHLANPPPAPDRAGVEEIMVIFLLQLLPRGKAWALAQTLDDSGCA